MGLHLKSTRPLSPITEISTGSTAIEKNINENLPGKEKKIYFEELSEQNPLLLFGLSLFCCMAILKGLVLLINYNLTISN